jgi:hypothetical protein
MTKFYALAVAGVLAVAGCAAPEQFIEAPVDLGDFHLGYNVVIADNAQKIPPSRDATPEEWEALLTAEIAERLGRYQGGKYYHIGVSVDGFALAVPGVPVVLAPKSAVVLSVNVWDDRKNQKLTAEPKRLTVVETLSGESVIGTGYTQTREEQLDNLVFNAAKALENYLKENADTWFTEGPFTPEGLPPLKDISGLLNPANVPETATDEPVSLSTDGV